MTPEEIKINYMRVMNHENTGITPMYAPPVCFGVGYTDVFEKGPKGGGYDGYNVRWEPVEGGRANVPATDVYTLTDVTKWREQICFPDLDAIDWEAKAKAELANFDPNTQVLEYRMGNATFERLLAWTGYQYLIDALLDEPEAVHEIIDTWTEHRLHFIELVCKYYKPDYVAYNDDVAFQTGLFLTKGLYEEFIQPSHVAMNKKIRECGSIPILHCCGKADDLIENFIEEGAQAWTSVQPMNDIAGILEKYHDKITICGGYNSNGKPCYEDSSEEERLAEGKRVIDEYANWGSFMVFGTMFVCSDPVEKAARMQRALDYMVKYDQERKQAK